MKIGINDFTLSHEFSDVDVWPLAIPIGIVVKMSERKGIIYFHLIVLTLKASKCDKYRNKFCNKSLRTCQKSSF